MYSPAIKTLFSKKLSEYTVLSTNHTQQTFKPYSYIPTLLLSLLSFIIFSLAVTLWYENRGLMFGLVLAVSFCLLISSIMLIPQVTRVVINRNLGEYDVTNEKSASNNSIGTKNAGENNTNQKTHYEVDWLGQMILIKKQTFPDCEIVKANPFSTTAVIMNNSLNPFLWIYIWVLVTFLRPGYLIVKCQNEKTQEKVLVCTCHLAIGMANQKRIL